MDGRELVCLDDSGGRNVIVGTEGEGQRVYNISSSAMSRANPHWKAMFSPTSRFRESQPDVPVEFPEDVQMRY
jgi:hypothetical protein